MNRKSRFGFKTYFAVYADLQIRKKQISKFKVNPLCIWNK